MESATQTRARVQRVESQQPRGSSLGSCRTGLDEEQRGRRAGARHTTYFWRPSFDDGLHCHHHPSTMRLYTRSRARGLSILLSLSLALALLLLATLTLAQTSYYKLLDIDPSSDARTIKKAYRRLAHKLHPDKFPEKEAEFVKMSEAYQVLSDDELRKVYDRYGEEGVKRHRAGQAGGGGGGGHDPFDIFRNFFGGGGAGGGGGVRKGQSKQFNIMVSLKDLYVGKTIHLEYDRSVVCHKCDGSGARSKGDVHSCEACQGRGVRIVRQEIMPGCECEARDARR